jgi:molybdopterin converting factor small subunit
MVKAELSYNPYLLETKIKFNGQEPKINSLVEKYKSSKLQDWIKTLPTVFYNEMNGYDFDLYFSGTNSDYEALKNTFNNVLDAEKVSRDSVCIFHKNELEDVATKISEIESLFEWFASNSNDYFNYSEFRETNTELLDDGYTILVIQHKQFDEAAILEIRNVNIEHVFNVNELEQANLSNTPILFYIDDENREEFRSNLPLFIKRKNITQEQIFFLLNTTTSNSQVEREIKDLLIKRPKFVKSAADEGIREYLEVYPMADYVAKTITLLREEYNTIKNTLDVENEKSIIANSEIRQEINRLDSTIAKLKVANESIIQRDNFEIPIELMLAKQNLLMRIQNWKKNKVTINNYDDANRISYKFESDYCNYFREFIMLVESEFEKNVDEIDRFFSSKYASAEFEDEYVVMKETILDFQKYSVPRIVPVLLDLKYEVYVQTQEKGLGLFRSSTTTEPGEFVQKVTYEYNVWRNKVTEIISPIIDGVTSEIVATLQQLYDYFATEYQHHLEELIDKHTRQKDEISAQLSDDERKLQADNEWLVAFDEKLHEIERG